MKQTGCALVLLSLVALAACRPHRMLAEEESIASAHDTTALHLPVHQPVQQPVQQPNLFPNCLASCAFVNGQYCDLETALPYLDGLLGELGSSQPVKLLHVTLPTLNLGGNNKLGGANCVPNKECYYNCLKKQNPTPAPTTSSPVTPAPTTTPKNTCPNPYSPSMPYMLDNGCYRQGSNSYLDGEATCNSGWGGTGPAVTGSTPQRCCLCGAGGACNSCAQGQVCVKKTGSNGGNNDDNDSDSNSGNGNSNSNGGVCVSASATNTFPIGEWVNTWSGDKFICGCYTNRNTPAPTTASPVTPAPTTAKQTTTPAPTTASPVTPAPTTAKQTSTPAPTAASPVTPAPTTAKKTTTPAPTTALPVTPAPTTAKKTTTPAPTTASPGTPAPTTAKKTTTPAPTTASPVTPAPTTAKKTTTPAPTTASPVTPAPTTAKQTTTPAPTTSSPVTPAPTSTAKGTCPNPYTPGTSYMQKYGCYTQDRNAFLDGEATCNSGWAGSGTLTTGTIPQMCCVCGAGDACNSCAQGMICAKNPKAGTNGGICVPPSTPNTFPIGEWVNTWSGSKFICGCYI